MYTLKADNGLLQIFKRPNPKILKSPLMMKIYNRPRKRVEHVEFLVIAIMNECSIIFSIVFFLKRILTNFGFSLGTHTLILYELQT